MTTASYTTGYQDVGIHTVTVTVSDDGMLTDSQDVTVTVNDVDTTPPASPEGIGISNPDKITWNRNSESDLEGYIVYRNGERFIASTRVYVVIKGRDKHKDWKKYYVKAYDTSGNLSGQSDTITIKFKRNRIIQA
jgi:PKD repeat protein